MMRPNAVRFFILALLVCGFSPSLTLSETYPPQTLLKKERESWTGIYFGEDKIGYSHTVLRPKGGIVEAFEELRLRMSLLGTEQNIDIKGVYTLKGYNLQSFEFSMKAEGVDLKAAGEGKNGEIKMSIISAGNAQEIKVPIRDKTLVSAVLPLWLTEKGISPGKTYEVLIFDPAVVLSGAAPEDLKATLSIEGKEEIKIPVGKFSVYRVKTFFKGIESTTWITEEGEVIKEVSPPGLVALKETKEKAFGEGLSTIDLALLTAVSSNVELKDARGLDLLKVKISGIPSTEGLTLSDHRQSLREGTIRIKREDVSQIVPYDIPYKGSDYRPYLEATHLIQSESPIVGRKSQEILEGEKNALRAAEKLEEWVYRSLQKTPTVSIPSALDVLKTRRGDCNEHATLFAALSRAAGIPTKIALGVVYFEGRFFYHAWDEVFVGKWVSVDPTFGQFPADASHIKLIEGDLSKSIEIMKLIGRINIKIEEAS